MLRDEIELVNENLWSDGKVIIKPIQTEAELAYAILECQLTAEQQECVNPAGFSIGRAYLAREDNYPCLIYNIEKKPVGFISLCKWLGMGDAYSWSFYVDKNYQGQGYGKSAANIAVQILKAANPDKMIKLATEEFNVRAQKLYISIGFKKLQELDGDDFVFGL